MRQSMATALLGMIALGAFQGLGAELYREALAFNAARSPDNDLHTAHCFKAVQGVDWRNADPCTVMGAAYCSVGCWYR